LTELIFITGMSGAGKTTAIQCLEDIGYFCIDNFPPILLPKFLTLIKQAALTKIALVIDLRGGKFFSSFFETLNFLVEKEDIRYKIFFLDADDKTLVARYKATRRRHPLASTSTPFLGILKERRLLKDIKEKSFRIIDTSKLKPYQLKEKINNIFLAKDTSMSISFVSFGFKNGILIDADLIFDVRFLPNPHYIDDLRPLTGKDEKVASYVLNYVLTTDFLKRLTNFLEFLFPLYVKEGKTQLVIGIGCTGGRHRSVVIVHSLYNNFKDTYNCTVSHRDIGKEG